MTKRLHPLLLGSLIAVMVLSWSFNFIFAKIGLRYWTPWGLVSFRAVLAALILAPLYLLWGAGLRTPSGEIVAGRSRRRDFWIFVQLGLLNVAINQTCFTVGLQYTTVGHSALIIGMTPILILLLARLQGLEPLTLKKVLGMALAFAGVTALASEQGIHLHSGTFLGDVITFTGSVAFALYTVLGKKAAAVYDSVSMNAFNYFVGTVVLLPVGAYEAARLTRAHAWGKIRWPGWAALLFMVLFASVIAYLIFFWMLRHMAASRLGAFSYLHPVLTTLLGIALLGEHLTRTLLLGGALVLTGVYLIESGREAQREAKVAGRRIS